MEVEKIKEELKDYIECYESPYATEWKVVKNDIDKIVKLEVNAVLNREIEEINKFLERLRGYGCGYHKQLEKQMLNRIKKLKQKINKEIK